MPLTWDSGWRDWGDKLKNIFYTGSEAMIPTKDQGMMVTQHISVATIMI